MKSWPFLIENSLHFSTECNCVTGHLQARRLCKANGRGPECSIVLIYMLQGCDKPPNSFLRQTSTECSKIQGNTNISPFDFSSNFFSSVPLNVCDTVRGHQNEPLQTYECKWSLRLNNCKTHVRADEGKPVESSDPDSLFSFLFFYFLPTAVALWMVPLRTK